MIYSMDVELFIQFLGTYKLKFLTLHILGTSLGLGGATISDILFLKFLKDFRISKKEQEVLNILKSVVLGALLLIIISGAALYLPNAKEYNSSAPFLVKTIGVAVLTINGIILHLYIAPYLVYLNMKKQQKMGSAWHKIAFALGSISIISWYTVFAIAMLKSLMNISFLSLLGIYITLLIVGVIGSQIVEIRMTKKALMKSGK